MLAAIAMILIVAAINLRGIAESVKVNLVLTAIEVFGLSSWARSTSRPACSRSSRSWPSRTAR